MRSKTTKAELEREVVVLTERLRCYEDNAKRDKATLTAENARLVEELRVTRIGLQRRRLPDERPSIVHRFSVGGKRGTVIVGLFDDGTPGELFLRSDRAGSHADHMADAFAIVVSLALQHRVPLRALTSKFKHTAFEPSGVTTNPEIPIAQSILDYVARWLELRFLGGREVEE